MISYHLLKVLLLAAVSFLLALSLTPILAEILTKFKVGKNIRNDGTTPLFSTLHAAKQGTPTMAGVLVWFTTGFIIIGVWLLDTVLDVPFFHKLNFLTHRETLLPLGAFLGASAVGLVDDIMDVRRIGHKGRGLRFRHKFFLYLLVASIGAYWFFFKLGFDFIQIPFYGAAHLGWLYVPFFILVIIGTSFSVNQTDGLDGLAGGTLLFSFIAYGLIAYLQQRYELAAFIAVIIGSLLAFLWFNIHPARFFMGDTGSMGLGTVLAVIAFLVHGELVLPIIGLVFAIEGVSTILQIFWRKFFRKKLILSAPLHNHLQAIGWPEAKVTMRLWIIAMVFGVLGVMIHFAGMYEFVIK